MTVSTKRRVLSLALVFASAVALSARQDVTLRYVWPKGETIRYKSIHQTSATISGAPGAQGSVSIDQTLTQVVRNIGKDVTADGTSTVEQAFESVQMDMSTPMGKIAFDSANAKPSSNPIEEMMVKMFTGIINQPFTVILSPSGIQKVEGVGKITEKVLATLPPSPQLDQILGNVKASMSDEGMLATLSQAMPQLPTKAVKVGETWQGRYTVPNPALGTMTFSYESTLKSLEGQIAQVQTKLTVTNDAASATPNPMGLKLTLGAASGTVDLSFDTAKGRIQKVVTSYAMPITMAGTAPDGTVLNIKNDGKTTLTLELMQ